MTEVVEYALVVMVSALFITGSVAVYDSFSAFESNLQLKGTMASITDVAYKALAAGNASGRVSVPESTIGCEDGSLTLSSGSEGFASQVPAECDFAVSLPPGEHALIFSVSSGNLTLEAS